MEKEGARLLPIIHCVNPLSDVIFDAFFTYLSFKGSVVVHTWESLSRRYRSKGKDLAQLFYNVMSYKPGRSCPNKLQLSYWPGLGYEMI